MSRRLNSLLTPGLAAVAVLATSPALWAQSASQPSPDTSLPSGVEQLLPRGQIAAVFEPTFVAAEDAEISDDAWVLGVEFDGVARAYSLNLLNRHEVVNDRIGETAFAAVW